MAKTDAPQRDMTAIGEVASPVFVRLPDPVQLFSARAARFRFLAEGHDLKPYLLFLAGIAEAQHRAQDGLPAAGLPDLEHLKRAREFAMPPLDRAHFILDPAFEATLARFLALAADIEMPESAAAALGRLKEADSAAQAEMVRSILDQAFPMETLAEHLYVAAALQIHFARLAARLDAKSLVPVGDGACPVCGGPPASSMVVGWQGAHGTRYCGCSLCGTLWNYVRIKCTLCGSTAGISYQEIEGGPGTVKAETCRSCNGYVKILHQHLDPAVDVIADDVASLGLDLLVRETGFKRGGVNPFLVGY
ncbi:MAG TPA: formate dehydrogenase accessory protein FdhE [Dongiaceae bacterium]|jgi:FdhE protein|nr:formate dehydrogenase accessory protein FdhE [Dongiaceae bacterium]